MNPFALVNEIAVVSTAFLMLAVSTVWYAPAFFGGNGPAGRSEGMLAVVRVIGYSIALFVLSYLATYRAIIDLSLWQVGVVLCALVVPLIVVMCVSVGRPVKMIIADSVFTVIFVCVGLLVVTYWPW